MEFALVAIPFLFLMIATTDLGRYFITLHSLRTLTAEAARSVMVNCFGGGACCLTTTQISAAEAKTPFLVPASFRTVPSACQQAPDASGLRTVTVSAQYPFTFIFLVWSALSGPISETMTFAY
jgi:hypothetical protein